MYRTPSSEGVLLFTGWVCGHNEVRVGMGSQGSGGDGILGPMMRCVNHGLVLLAALGLAACSAPGTPAPVATAPEASPSAWQWQSEEPATASSDLAITGGATASASPAPSEAPTTETATRRLAHQPGVAGQPMAAVGECVDLQRAEDGHTSFAAKPCDQPHQAQVVGFIDVHDGPQAPAPPLSRLQGLAAQHCPILGGEFVGTTLSSRRDLTVNWTGPSRREWAGGARTLICMLSGAPTPDGQGTQPLTADLRSSGQADQPVAPAPQPAASAVPPAPAVQPDPAAPNP